MNIVGFRMLGYLRGEIEIRSRRIRTQDKPIHKLRDKEDGVRD